MKAKIIYNCDLCGKRYDEHKNKVSDYFVLYKKNHFVRSKGEHATYPQRLKVKLELYPESNRKNIDLCNECIAALDNQLAILKEKMSEIFNNKVWREVDKVYETRWDCRIVQREAA